MVKTPAIISSNSTKAARVETALTFNPDAIVVMAL